MYKNSYDVIVMGAGPGGIPAAIAAARMGMSVLLVERNSYLGGLLVSGLPLLGYLDRSKNQVIGGIAQEIVDRLKPLGGVNEHLPSPILNSMTHVNPAWMRVVISEMCMEEENLDVLLYSDLLNVDVDNNCVKGVTVVCRGELMHFDTKIVIDATGDGCVLFKAGGAYEKSEHLQPMSLTFDLINVDYDKITEYLETHPEDATLPDTFVGLKNDLSFLKNSCNSFMGFRKLVEEGRKEGTFTFDRNMFDFCRQIDDNAFINTTRIVNVDSTNPESIINAEFEGLRQIKDLIAFLRTHLPGFENCQLSAICPGVGVRESRRLVGVKQLKEENVMALEIPEDTVAMVGYNMDTHSPVDGKMYMVPIEHGVGIPYGCMVPESINGLLMSGRCISVTHQVFAMTRIIPTCMAIGQAVGTAAAIAVKQGIQPRDVDVQELRKALVEAGQIISL